MSIGGYYPYTVPSGGDTWSISYFDGSKITRWMDRLGKISNCRRLTVVTYGNAEGSTVCLQPGWVVEGHYLEGHILPTPDTTGWVVIDLEEIVSLWYYEALPESDPAPTDGPVNFDVPAGQRLTLTFEPVGDPS